MYTIHCIGFHQPQLKFKKEVPDSIIFEIHIGSKMPHVNSATFPPLTKFFIFLYRCANEALGKLKK